MRETALGAAGMSIGVFDVLQALWGALANPYFSTNHTGDRN